MLLYAIADCLLDGTDFLLHTIPGSPEPSMSEGMLSITDRARMHAPGARLSSLGLTSFQGTWIATKRKIEQPGALEWASSAPVSGH